MKIKKVDDKPMVIHTKEKAKIHAHEPKGAKIKGSNIYTVERGPKVHDAKANEMDKKASAKLMLQKSAGGKRTYRKSTIHQSEAKDKGLSRFKRNIRESGTSIKTKNTNLHIAGRTGVLAAGAVTEQVEGGHEVSQAAYLAYESSRPVTGTASKGAALFRKKAAAEARKRIKKVEAGKKLAKRTAKKAAKDTAKTVAKETAKETAKTTAKVATKTATKAAATAAGTAVAPGVGTAIGMAAGYAAGVSIEVKDEKMTNRSRKIKFFLDKMKAQENQTDSVAKLVKDLIVRKAITWVKAAAPIIGLVLLLLVLVVAMIAVPVIAVIAILYNSPFALFLPPLESGDTVQTVTSAYVQEFNRDVNTKVNEHTGYDLGELVYNYVDGCLFDIRNIDLPRKVKYRPRYKKPELKVDRGCRVGRNYHDYEVYMEQHPDTAVVQMDSVIGSKGGKVLLTIYFVNVSLMLGFLREANTSKSVIDIYDELYHRLGGQDFRKLFPVILTDNGSEFSNPKCIENGPDGKGFQRTRIYYCNPSAPYQKAEIEVGHEFIRRILPKGRSFDELTQADVELMMNHINSYRRKKLNGKSPYEAFSFYYGEDLAERLRCHEVAAKDINLTARLLKK